MFKREHTEPHVLVLESLPTFPVRPLLWGRIESTHRRRARLKAAVGFALAATAVFGAVLVARMPVAPVLEPIVAGSALNESMARSRALELDLAAARGSRAADARFALEGELARLDDHLQRAYDRNAGDEELSRLWSARSETLATLVAAYQNPAAVRI